MSTAALKTAATTGTQVAKAEKPQTIAGLLTDPKIKAQMQLALPKHVTADRLARIALTEVRKNPKLGQCDQTSFLGAIMQCAALGLEPGGALGHCYLIPFENKRARRFEAQFIIGYRGMLDLARRSGQIISLEARAVYERDHFEVELGLDSRIVHRPSWTSADRGKLTFVYAVAKLKDGGVQFDVMSRAEIEVIRNSSQGYKSAEYFAQKDNKQPSSTWHDHFEPMALKTVIRRLFKYLPVSIEMQRAVAMDELADAGLPQDNLLVIDGEYELASQNDPTTGNEEIGAQSGGITAQEIHDAMAAAVTEDALNDAWDLSRDLPPEQQQELLPFYQQRALDLKA
ncbi:MAG TPA: recombination protein RecT [Acidobacteriaceae bacterium]